MISPYQARQLSHYEAEVLEELILSKRAFSFSKEKGAPKIRFVKNSVLAKESLTSTIALTVNEEKIELTLQATPESSLAHQWAELGEVKNIPQEFLAAMKAFYSKKIIDAFEYFFEIPVTLWKEGDAVTTPPEKKELFFEIFNSENFLEGKGSISLSPFLLTKLIEVGKKIPTLPTTPLNSTSLSGEIVVGSASISTTDWNKLNVGSLIFLQEPSPLVTGEAFFFFGNNKKLPLLLDVKQMSSLVTPLSKLSFAAPSFSEDMSHEQLSNLALSLELNFSAGALSLSLEEILLLEKNKKINQLPTLFQPLKILAQGKHIGAGKLIAIHDQYALFVTQLH